MSTAPPVAPPSDPDAERVVAFDPATAKWLVLQQASVDGMPTWLVDSTHDSQAAAEYAAGHHVAAVRAWLLRDPALGWRASHGWLHDYDAAAVPEMDEALAREMAAINPDLELWVVRTNGRRTRPNLAPGA